MKIGFAIFAFYKLIQFILLGATDRIFSTGAVFVVLLLPSILRKLQFPLKDSTECVYLLFVFLAQILGSVVNLYASLWWWDLFVHGLSGALTCYLALLILEQFHLLSKKHHLFILLFMLSFSLAIASSWEFLEFTSDKISGGDTQWVQKTGVDDTMTDMLIAAFGSVVYTSGYYTFSLKR